MKRKYIGGIVLSLGLLVGCGQNQDNNQSLQEQVQDLQKEQQNFIKRYGYGIEPQTRSDEILIGVYGVPFVAIYTKDGDTLESLSKILYNDQNKSNRLADQSIELRNFKRDDSLPSGLRVKTCMFEYQLEHFKRDFPNRKVEALE